MTLFQSIFWLHFNFFLIADQQEFNLTGTWVCFKSKSPLSSQKFKLPIDTIYFSNSGKYRRVFYQTFYSTGRDRMYKYMELEGQYILTDDSIIYKNTIFQQGLQRDTLDSYGFKLERLDSETFISYEHLKRGKGSKLGKERRYFRKIN